MGPALVLRGFEPLSDPVSHKLHKYSSHTLRPSNQGAADDSSIPACLADGQSIACQGCPGNNHSNKRMFFH